MSYCEDLCAKSLNLIFEDRVVIFRNYRPDWLKNPSTNKNLELDFYLPHVKVAIEIQGQHHYDDMAQRIRDNLKRKICKLNDVKLIEIGILQINPSLLRRKILGYVGNYKKVKFLKTYDKKWETLPEIVEYKRKIKENYSQSSCVKSPNINFDEEIRQRYYDDLDKNILSRIEYPYIVSGTSCHVTPIEIISRKKVKCRIFGTDKIIFIKKKFFEDILGV